MLDFMRRILAALVCVAAGCGTPRWATIDGRRVARPTLGYSDGASYKIEHRLAYPDVFAPGRALRVDDGRITGKACDIDVDFDVAWYGARISLVGRLDVPWIRDFTNTEGILKLDLDVHRIAPGRHHIVGSIFGRPIDIDAGPERLSAQIADVRYDLAADGGYLAGRRTGVTTRHHFPERIDEPVIIWGREALATMQPADIAIVLMTMLPCSASLERNGQHVRGFSLVPL
jgi:hypothetical protein